MAALRDVDAARVGASHPSPAQRHPHRRYFRLCRECFHRMALSKSGRRLSVTAFIFTPGVFDNTLFHAGASMPPSFQIPEMLCSRTEIRKYNQLVGDPVAK